MSDLLGTVRTALRPLGKVMPFGSRFTGLADSDSDFDFALMLDDPYRSVESALDSVSGRLRNYGASIILVLKKARAPLVRAQLHGQQFEVVVNGEWGVVNSMIVRELLAGNDNAVAIVKAMKQWAKSWDLIDASLGRLSSFAITVFTIRCLQRMGIVRKFKSDGRLQMSLRDIAIHSRSDIVAAVMESPHDLIRIRSTKDPIYSVMARLKESLDAPGSLLIQDFLDHRSLTGGFQARPAEELRKRAGEALEILKNPHSEVSDINRRVYYSGVILVSRG